jgi:hypothetical protein
MLDLLQESRMNHARLWALSLLVVASLAVSARGQAFMPIPLEGAGGSYSLVPMAGYEGPPLGPNMRAQGTVAGRGTSALGTIEIGFDYIRPYWSSRDFILAVPPAYAGSFPLLGDVGHVDNHFALAPRLNYKYDVSDVFALKATGSFLNLNGHLERTASADDGSTGILTANSSLTIITATLPEISTRFFYDELFAGHSHLYWSLFDDLIIDLSIGTRFASIEQNYTGKLNNTIPGGRNETQRYAHQDFKGVGITTGLNFLLPVHPSWDLYTTLRGSILVGENNKDSSLSVNLQGQPGISSSITQSKTEFVPVAEIEIGAAWTHVFGDVSRPEIPPALFTVRMGLSGQVWGNIGPLSAGSPQGYQTSNLFLVGAHIMVGLAR